MKINFLSIISLSLFFTACEQKATEKDYSKNSIDSRDDFKSQIPSDYYSDDGNVSITFYDNGNIKEITVISDVYETPYDTSTGLGGHVYLSQRLSYDSNRRLQTVDVIADSLTNFWYSYDEKNDKREVRCYGCGQ